MAEGLGIKAYRDKIVCWRNTIVVFLARIFSRIQARRNTI